MSQPASQPPRDKNGSIQMRTRLQTLTLTMYPFARLLRMKALEDLSLNKLVTNYQIRSNFFFGLPTLLPLERKREREKI